QGAHVDLTFNLRRDVSPTQVIIQNLNTSANPGQGPDIVLAGKIENPIGQTRITALRGDIVAATNRDGSATGLGGLYRTTLIQTRDLTLEAQTGTVGYDAQFGSVGYPNPVPALSLSTKNHLAVDIVESPLLTFDAPHGLETGNVVTYHSSAGAAAALGGLVNDASYYVIRLDDFRIRLANTLADAFDGKTIAIDPANLVLGTHTIAMSGGPTLTITDGIRLVAQAGADDYIDIKGRLRDPAALLGGSGSPNPHTFNIDLVQAGMTGNGTVDVTLQSAVREAGTQTAGGVRVRAKADLPADSQYFARFRNDDAALAGSFDIGFFGGTETAIRATYNFVDPTGGTGTAGLVANGSETTGNIVVTAVNSTPGATQVNVTGITEILGGGGHTGHIDVLTNGFVALTEQTGDMRVGSITSTANDVLLTAPQSIVDALADIEADVTGVNIILKSVAGLIGSTDNFLEINLLDTVSGVAQSGTLTAEALQGIYVEETVGDLRVNTVFSHTADVTLASRAGSIIDSNTQLVADRDARMVDRPNIVAVNVDLRASGGSIGLRADDLDIDSGSMNGLHVFGRLYAQADQNIFITESNYELNVLGAKAAAGDVRLTVPDTSLTPVFASGDPSQTTVAGHAEDLVLLDTTGVLAHLREGQPLSVDSAQIVAGLSVALWVGDNVVTNAGSRIGA
ncbi:MAG: hypothetical protein ABIZ69_01765, partial [Ilumatobacteraceae bacterium]